MKMVDNLHTTSTKYKINKEVDRLMNNKKVGSLSQNASYRKVKVHHNKKIKDACLAKFMIHICYVCLI
jgi:hypothetical protein